MLPAEALEARRPGPTCERSSRALPSSRFSCRRLGNLERDGVSQSLLQECPRLEQLELHWNRHGLILARQFLLRVPRLLEIKRGKVRIEHSIWNLQEFAKISGQFPMVQVLQSEKNSERKFSSNLHDPSTPRPGNPSWSRHRFLRLIANNFWLEGSQEKKMRPQLFPKVCWKKKPFETPPPRS